MIPASLQSSAPTFFNSNIESSAYVYYRNKTLLVNICEKIFTKSLNFSFYSNITYFLLFFIWIFAIVWIVLWILVLNIPICFLWPWCREMSKIGCAWCLITLNKCIYKWKRINIKTKTLLWLYHSFNTYVYYFTPTISVIMATI